MPRHKHRVNFDPDTSATQKLKSFPISTLESSKFKPPTQQPHQFVSLDWNQVKLHPPHRNQINFDHPHKTQVNVDAHTKNKSFRPPYKNRVNFDHPNKKPCQSIPALITSHFRTTHKTQVNFNHPHKNQVNFGPHTKTKSILIPSRKTGQLRSAH